MPAALGECQSDWCCWPAVAYVSGPTVGRSPRVTVIAGERAAQLGAAAGWLDTYGSLKCIDCVLAAVEDATGHVPAGPAPG